MGRLTRHVCVICGQEFFSTHAEARICSEKCRRILSAQTRAAKNEGVVSETIHDGELVIMPDDTMCRKKHCKVCGKPYLFPYVWEDENGRHSTGVECCCIQHTDELYGYVKKGGTMKRYVGK